MSGGEEDVNPLLNKTECFCLNESSSSPHSNVIELGSSLLTSNDDEQLLLHLSLRQTVKLTSIVFTSPSDESCPQTVQLFVNKNNLDFGQASGQFSFETVVNLKFLLVVSKIISSIFLLFRTRSNPIHYPSSWRRHCKGPTPSCEMDKV